MALPGSTAKVPILSTAGAVPVKNEKGELTMEKVKVQRYITGKRPVYAEFPSDDEDDIEFGQTGKIKMSTAPLAVSINEKEDRRLKRMQDRQIEDSLDHNVDEESKEERVRQHRRLHQPEVLQEDSNEEDGDGEFASEDDESTDQEEELDEAEIETRRLALREKVQKQRQEEELMLKENIEEHSSEEESSEYEEYSEEEEEEEDIAPRLKPIFVRKKDRVTIQEAEKEIVRQKELEMDANRKKEERKRETLRLVEEISKRIENEEKIVNDPADAINTDDENDEEEYEKWKLRELNRIKRDREDREKMMAEKGSIEQIHNMTDEQRKRWFQENRQKKITNQTPRGEYKFLQKYYHRGAFYLDKEEGVLKRDFSAPTLEDHFNKSILPEVMQVKNFGRSGRTKYTHLLDQDTSERDNSLRKELMKNVGGGMKESFERPSAAKRK